jgi:hypothetical protein
MGSEVADARAAALDELVEVSALWGMSDRVGYVAVSGAKRAVVAAATDALVAGLDSPALRELAGLPDDTAWGDTAHVITTTMTELGVTFDPADLERSQVLALRYVCRRYLANELTIAAVAEWAESFIGYDGAAAAQDVVRLSGDISGESYPLFTRRKKLPELVAACRQSYRDRVEAFLAATA